MVLGRGRGWCLWEAGCTDRWENVLGHSLIIMFLMAIGSNMILNALLSNRNMKGSLSSVMDMEGRCPTFHFWLPSHCKGIGNPRFL